MTLYHWDLPSALQDKTNNSAWLNKDIINQFNDYAEFCFKTFGPKVKKWITFNEPQSFAWLAYGVGVNAPGRCSDYMSPDCQLVGGGGDTPTEPYIVPHNVFLSHGKAV